MLYAPTYDLVYLFYTADALTPREDLDACAGQAEERGNGNLRTRTRQEDLFHSAIHNTTPRNLLRNVELIFPWSFR